MFKKRTPDPEQRVALGQVIRAARNRYGLTQEALAERMNCSVRWLIQIESGESCLNCIDTIHVLALLQLNPAEVAEEVGIHVLVPANGE